MPNYFQTNIGDSFNPTHKKSKGTWKEKSKRSAEIWNVALKEEFDLFMQRCFAQHFPYLLDAILTENPFEKNYSDLPPLSYSPLHVSLFQPDVEYVHICMKHKFSTKHAYLYKGAKQPRTVEELVRGGIVSMDLALITCPEVLAETPGLLVKTMSQYQCKKNLKSILQLINANICINDQQPSTLYTPLHVAAFFGSVPAVIALLEKGARPNEHDKEGYNPLMKALTSSDGYNLEIVKLLVEGGCEIEYQTHRRRDTAFVSYNALCLAANLSERKEKTLDFEIISYLSKIFEDSVSPTRYSMGNETILHMLCQNNPKKTITEGIYL